MQTKQESCDKTRFNFKADRTKSDASEIAFLLGSLCLSVLLGSL